VLPLISLNMVNLLNLISAFLLLSSPALAEDARSMSLEPQRLVELFTSQGCGACPEANQLLATLDADTSVLGLSFAVDYWDMLGWKDTFAAPENAKRQRAYARRLDNKRVYTPQLVIDGAVNVPAGRQDRLEMALQANRPSHSISLTQNSDALVLNAPSKPDISYWVTRIAFRAGSETVTIAKGENRGIEMPHHNVVQSIGEPMEWRGGSLSLAPRSDGFSEAVIVQAGFDGPVVAAFELTTF
jgi:hypothetical protein